MRLYSNLPKSVGTTVANYSLQELAVVQSGGGMRMWNMGPKEINQLAYQSDPQTQFNEEERKQLHCDIQVAKLAAQEVHDSKEGGGGERGVGFGVSFVHGKHTTFV